MSDFADVKEITLMGSALAIGLLIGVERGWRLREEKDGMRVAGIRTFGLTGLLGGSAGLLAQYIGMVVFGFIFLGFTTAVTIIYAMQRHISGDASITSLITMLLTFMLGALATLDHVLLATSTAVVAAILLRFKDTLHAWLRGLQQPELHAALQLLLISIVVLPILPDRGYGPWQAFNPYETWWMVVLIASLSFVGYFVMKTSASGKGVVFTALAAGIVSSTALTLHFSRLSRQQKSMKNLLATGILVACGTMFPRIVLVASLINPALFKALIIPMAVMTILTFSAAAILWNQGVEYQPNRMANVNNPLELKTALTFGALLVLIIFVGKAAVHYFGETGIYILAAVSGIVDVDPINLALARMSGVELSLDIAILSIVIAASSNTLVKGVLALFIGGPSMGARIVLPLLFVVTAGLTTAWLF